jgi:hypothetical protein
MTEYTVMKFGENIVVISSIIKIEDTPGFYDIHINLPKKTFYELLTNRRKYINLGDGKRHYTQQFTLKDTVEFYISMSRKKIKERLLMVDYVYGDTDGNDIYQINEESTKKALEML